MRISIWRILPAIIFSLVVASQAYGQAAFDVSPTSIDFGSVPVNTTATRTVTVTNNNDGTVTFSVGINNGSDPAYSIARQPTTTTLRSGESTTFDIGFTPTRD